QRRVPPCGARLRGARWRLQVRVGRAEEGRPGWRLPRPSLAPPCRYVAATASCPPMTRFAELVAVSDAVATTRSRTEKVGRLADFLRSVPPGAVASTLRFLSGRSGRERLGVGPAAVDEARRAAPAAAG